MAKANGFSGKGMGSKPPPLGMTSGDWYCPACNDLQFGRNTHCRKCQTPKPPDGFPAQMDPAQMMAFTQMFGQTGSMGANPAQIMSLAQLGNPLMPSGAAPSKRFKTNPLDWNCPACGDLQFAKNVQCRKCGHAKPLGGMKPNGMPGDWACPACGDVQFARNMRCRSCGQDKPADAAGFRMDPGDWICPRCNDLQFAKNTHCRKCRGPKPEGLDDAAGGSNRFVPY